MVRYCSGVLLLGHVSKIVSILLSKLSDGPNTDTLLCYYNYPFLKVNQLTDLLFVITLSGLYCGTLLIWTPLGPFQV